MYAELKSFMRKVFGNEEGELTLKRLMDQVGITDLYTATNGEKQNLAKRISEIIPYRSITRSHMARSELLKILKISKKEEKKDRLKNAEEIYDENGYKVDKENLDPTKKYFTSKKEFMEYKIEQQKKAIFDFWNKVSMVKPMIDSAFNLYWMKANQAHKHGVSEEKIMKVTQRSLKGIFMKLNEAYEEVSKRLGMKDISKPIKKRLGTEEEKKVIEEINKFWRKINQSYEKFRKAYFSSLDKEINTSGDDSEIKMEARKKIKEAFNEINEAYEELSKSFRKIEKESLNI